MPRIEQLAFYFVAFWVCFFGGWAGSKDWKASPDQQGDINRSVHQRLGDQSIELMNVRSNAKHDELVQNKHHMHHLENHCRVLDRCVALDCRIKRLEQRMVIVVPQEMPPPAKLMDPRELDPSPNIPPQKLPITPND